MTKKGFIAISMAFTVLEMCACSDNNSGIEPTSEKAMVVTKENPADVAVEAKVVSYDSLEDMEKSADVIAVVKKGDILDTIVLHDKGEVYSGYTFSQVEIVNGYKTEEGMGAGTTLRVLENEFYDETTNTVYHISGYNMMVKDHEYLLFLDEKTYSDGEKYYVPLGVNFGAIPLADEDYNMAEKSIDYFNYLSPIWSEAKEKYQ